MGDFSIPGHCKVCGYFSTILDGDGICDVCRNKINYEKEQNEMWEYWKKNNLHTLFNNSDNKKD